MKQKKQYCLTSKDKNLLEWVVAEELQESYEILSLFCHILSY